MSKIIINENIHQIPSDRIGVDMGQTLSKIAYFERKELTFFSFPTQKSVLKIEEFLNSKKAIVESFNFTGGKSFNLYKEYSKDIKTKIVNEFEANVKGIELLYKIEKNKELPRTLIVTIGTGTSIVLNDDKPTHLGGSALGGGFFMGLINALFNLKDYQEALNLARKGNRYNVDLKVSDIYSPEDNRVDLLFREFTAASLGKITSEFNIASSNKEDFINSFICLIGENLGTIATIIADNNNVSNIVFCGGFLKENKILKKILSLLCRVNKKKAIFLKNSEFCAAFGALII